MGQTLLHTPEDQATWDDLIAQKAKLNEDILVADAMLAALAAKTFVHLLRTGTWKVSGSRYNTIEAADAAASEQVETIISTSLGLNHHDGFAIIDGNVRVYGRVSDGELTLNLYPERVRDGVDPEATQRVFKELRVDLDIAEWLGKLRVEALRKARSDLKKAQDLVAKLESEPE